mgnify:CR=1 FL=1
MDNEQSNTRVEWLDEELRKQKSLTADLQDRLNDLEGQLDASQKKNQELDSEVTRLRSMIGRVDDFDEDLADLRVKNQRQHQEMEKEIRIQVNEAKKVLQTRIKDQEERLVQIQEHSEVLENLERAREAQEAEDHRLHERYRDLSKDMAELRRQTEEQGRRVEKILDDRTKERKRIVDVQGELTAVRKRVDGQAGSLDLIKTDLEKITQRIEELEQLRKDLKKEQDSFLEQQALRNAERENRWKNWQENIDSLDKKKSELDERLKVLDATHRSVKRLQENIQDLSEHVDRRVNEITEMQRLAEERFQQEWKMFQADDQKRWTNYTLNQKEQRSEISRQTQDLAARVTGLEDKSQEVQDQIQQISTQSEQQLQSLQALVRDWLTDYQQIMDSVR